MELKSQPLTIKSQEEAVIEPNKTGIYISEEKAKLMIEDAIAKAKSEILHDAQSSYITVFGIFASITSFLVIEFQFLKGLKNINQVLGFTLVLGAMLHSFNIALDYLMKRSPAIKNQKLNWVFCLMTSLLLIVGIMFVVCGNNAVNY